MSVRRFLAYFLAVTAGSTVAFASFLSAPGAAAQEAAMQETGMETSPTPEMTRVFQEAEARQRHRAVPKRPQVAFVDYRLEN